MEQKWKENRKKLKSKSKIGINKYSQSVFTTYRASDEQTRQNRSIKCL